MSLHTPAAAPDDTQVPPGIRMPQQHPPHHGFDPVAGFMAILLPGLGHIVRGEKKRGLLAGFAVLAMFFGGMLIGGIDVIDSREDKWWFYGQALVGPIALAINHAHQTEFKAYGVAHETDPSGRVVYHTTERMLRGPHRLRSVFPGETRKVVDVEIRDANDNVRETRRMPVAAPAGPGEGPPNIKSLAKVNEIGTLYALCAGMLNLIVILDAMFPTRHRRKGDG